MFTLFLLPLDITVNAVEQEKASPKLVAPVVVPAVGCPSDEDRQAALQPLINKVVQHSSFNPNCGPGLWIRVFYLNTSSQDQSCRGGWNVRTVSSVRGCAGGSRTCRPAYSDVISSEYSRVCEKVIAIGIGTIEKSRCF